MLGDQPRLSQNVEYFQRSSKSQSSTHTPPHIFDTEIQYYTCGFSARAPLCGLWTALLCATPAARAASFRCSIRNNRNSGNCKYRARKNNCKSRNTAVRRLWLIHLTYTRALSLLLRVAVFWVQANVIASAADHKINLVCNERCAATNQAAKAECCAA